MSGRKGMKHYSKEQLGEMNRLREKGMSHRAIGEAMGLEVRQVRKCFERERRKERAIGNG